MSAPARPGTVVAVEGGVLVVAVDPDHACGSCAQRSGCGGRVRPLVLRVAAPAAGQGSDPPAPGSEVWLAAASGPLPAAVKGYLWPLLALFAGAVLGQLTAAGLLPAGAAPLAIDLGAALGALLGFSGGIAVLRCLDRPLTVACGSARATPRSG
jgi:sigma-E factor negative regulatory protein RseC